jgi:hypothetical protein
LRLSPSRASIAQFLHTSPFIPFFEAKQIVAEIPDSQLSSLHEVLTAANASLAHPVAMLLGAMLPRLSNEQRPAIATQALATLLIALQIDTHIDHENAPELVDAVAPYLSGDASGLLVSMATIFEEYRLGLEFPLEPYAWLTMLICMIPLTPEDSQQRYAAEVAENARRTLASSSEKAAGIIEIARRLPEGSRDSYLAEVLTLAETRVDPRRIDLLGQLLAAISPLERRRIVGTVTRLTGPGAPGTREVFVDAVAALFAGLPTQDSEEILEAAIGEIRNRIERLSGTPAGQLVLSKENEVVTPLVFSPATPGGSTWQRMFHWGTAGDPPVEMPIPAFEQELPPADEMPPGRDVSTGFAAEHEPTTPLDPDRTLVRGRRYIFWLEVGSPVAGRIDMDQVPLPEEVPSGAMLDVVVFPFRGEIETTPGHDVGRLVLNNDRSATVAVQPGFVRGAETNDQVAERRLLFPIRMPEYDGIVRLRCSIYHNQVLLQSRVVEARLDDVSRPHPGALRASVDYTLSHSLDPATLIPRVPYVASLMLNDNGNGTHTLRVLAADGEERLNESVTIAGGLGEQISMARGTLRRVAWGSDEDWRIGVAYRYGVGQPRPDFSADLIRLAATGFRLHHLLLRTVARRVGGDAYEAADRLMAVLRRPGFVQVALKESAQHVLPAALLYDYPLDTEAPKLTVCTAFLDSLCRETPLASTACFQGMCENASANGGTVVCPSGFWGYRHALGLPVSIGQSPDASEEITLEGKLRMAVAIYRDFTEVDAHCAAVRTLRPDTDWCLTTDRESTLRELHSRQPEIVYFYCHGGVSLSVPYLRVGHGTSGPVITPDNLFESHVRWIQSRPLVFLNGCRTTDLNPERAIDFVSFFVEDAWARGVIGTEITVFEELAHRFAEECLRRFLVERQPIGEAVRQARLALLHDLNPLGLAYIPFVMPTVRLKS